MLNPRYHSNCENIIFRHFPDSNKFFAFTQQYGRSLLGFSLSVPRLRSDRSVEGFDIALHHTATLCTTSRSDRLHHSLCCDIQICLYFNTLKCKSQGFFEKIFLCIYKIIFFESVCTEDLPFSNTKPSYYCFSFLSTKHWVGIY